MELGRDKHRKVRALQEAKELIKVWDDMRPVQEKIFKTTRVFLRSLARLRNNQFRVATTGYHHGSN